MSTMRSPNDTMKPDDAAHALPLVRRMMWFRSGGIVGGRRGLLLPG
jgi:hypothetical protein